MADEVRERDVRAEELARPTTVAAALQSVSATQGEQVAGRRSNTTSAGASSAYSTNFAAVTVRGEPAYLCACERP